MASKSAEGRADTSIGNRTELLKDDDYYYGSSDQEQEDYDAAEDENDLPDLYRYLEALDQAETDLDGPHKPPSLFDQPEHKHNFNNVSLLKYEVEESKVHQYVSQFETAAKDDILHVGGISLEEIQAEEKRLRDEHMAFQQQELNREKTYNQEMLSLENDAKRKMALELKEKRTQLARKVEIARQRERMQLDALHKSFKKCESRLTTNLTNLGADVQTMYGDLSLADGEYGGAKGRRWRMDWIYTPQPIQIKLKALRGVKDKLPGGRYVLMASLYDRIGGSVMRWSKLKGQQWGGASLPVIHNGNFYNFELSINQSVFTVLPPRVSLKPSMVLVFELFLLRGSVVQTDRVVSWGCFPICDNNMNIIEGKYKAPFLRGEIDCKIDKATKIEQLIASDLDNWMCNLYFDVIRLPRYLAGQVEFEAELQHTPDMLNDPQKAEQLAAGSGGGGAKTPASYLRSSDTDLKESGERAGDDSSERGHTPLSDGAGVMSAELYPSVDNSESSTGLPSHLMPEGKVRRPMTTYGSRFAKKEHQVHMDDSSSSDSEIEDEKIFSMKTKDDSAYRPVRGVPDLSYRRYLNEAADMYDKKVYTMIPKSTLLKKKRDKRRLTYREKLRLHTVSVKKPYDDDKGENARQYEHVRRQALLELGLTEPASRAFWSMLLVFVLTFFLRIYVHYVTQWLFLTARAIPINNFEFLPYLVKIDYHHRLTHLVEEIAVVALGPLSVFAVFVLLILLCLIWQKTVGSFPEIAHKFIFCLGVQAILDPVFIAVVDAGLQRWDYQTRPADSALADFVKLYEYYERTEGTGLGGIFITIFIYAFTVFLSVSVLYMYFLRLFNNGRMVDVYWRLHSGEDELFVPLDFELSGQELDSICKAAEQWRGEEGERRKVSVYRYEWEEDTTDNSGQPVTNKEKTTHISIHTVHLDGLRELYRHFLLAPNGAILEVFAEDCGDTGRQTPISRMSRASAFGPRQKVRGRETVFTRAGFHETSSLGSSAETRKRQSLISKNSGITEGDDIAEKDS